MIYLDNAATTKISQEVLNEMMPYLSDSYGNPGAIYGIGRDAAKAVDKSRARVADLINVDTEQIIFTASGSEANNLVFKGLEKHLLDIGKTHIAVSYVEHESVLRAAQSLVDRNIKDGFYLQKIPVIQNVGNVNPQTVKRILDEDEKIGLVSVMFVNNETGARNDIEEIGAICSERGVLFHTDCVQAAGFCEINVENIQCDFLTISSHKIHGPKGCGALYARNKELLQPIVDGGSAQEFGLRAGTENVPAIVGFGKACEIANQAWLIRAVERIQAGVFYGELMAQLEKYGMQSIFHMNSKADNLCDETSVPSQKILNFRFDGIDGETLLLMLDSRGVFVSSGSACTSHEQLPSHVLLSMGISEEDARNSIRVSISWMNSYKEMEDAAKIIVECVKELSELC